MQRFVAACIACASGSLALGGFDPYGGSFREVTAPSVAPGSFGVAGAALSDGRLIAATGLEVYVETAAGSGAFALAATIDPAITGGSDPGFLSVSPDGSRVAFGAGFDRPIVVFDASALDAGAPGVISAGGADVFDVDHFGAAWRDPSTIAVSNSSGVVGLDTLTGDTTTLVTNIGGASGGVAFDSAGNLYTANGFDFAAGGSVTGEIRAFAPGELASADFTTDGTFIAEILSGSPLHIDGFGNLIVGGGDSAGGDAGYVGVFDLTTGELAQYDPLGTGEAFYSAFVNDATGEMVIQSGSRWFVYQIPAPSAALLAPLGLAFAGRRRA
jgi:hypothetical protein